MLWNWYTVDTCFLSSSWHNTSKGMFAGSCIGVILLVVVLEALRRAGKEYDRYIVAQHAKSLASSSSHVVSSASSANGTSKTPVTTAEPACTGPVPAQHFRPSVMQQAVRALLHMLYVVPLELIWSALLIFCSQFAVAYFVMLLAMYYNGYIIISICMYSSSPQSLKSFQPSC
jgi:copper transporter 1